MKVVIRLKDNRSPIKIDGVVIPVNENFIIEKTESIKKAINQGLLIFVDNVNEVVVNDTKSSKPLKDETKSSNGRTNSDSSKEKDKSKTPKGSTNRGNNRRKRSDKPSN